MTYPIPKDALDDRLGFIGTSGSGKTYNAGGAVERLLKSRARVVIVDPLGVWWGLRLLADGKTASPFNVAIFGGPHGDLPLTENAGALIGETAATMAESCIVDLSELGSKSADRRFMTAFLDTIYRKAPGEPFHLVVDEADLFAPQKPPKGDETLLNLMEQIVRRGRVRGFIPWLISQRPAVLNKNVLSQVDGLIAFKLTASQDRDALDGWIEGQADKAQGRAIKDALPAMQIGNGVVWVPGRGVLSTAAFPMKETFDSSRTPKRGEKKQKTAALKPLDLGALKERLATVETETKANDPKALKAEVVRLTAELRKVAKAPAPSLAALDPAALTVAHRQGYDAGWSEGWLAGERAGFTRGVAAHSNEIKAALGGAAAVAYVPGAAPKAPKSGATVALPPPQRVVTPAPGPVQRAATVRPAPLTNGHDTAISPSSRKILDQIHAAYPVGLTFAAAAQRAVISKRSSAYDKYRREVEGSGEVTNDGGRLTSAPEFARPVQHTGNPVETWASRLPPSYANMLRAIANHGGEITPPEVAAIANVSPTSSGLGAGLKELVALDLIVRLGGSYVLSDALR